MKKSLIHLLLVVVLFYSSSSAAAGLWGGKGMMSLVEPKYGYRERNSDTVEIGGFIPITITGAFRSDPGIATRVYALSWSTAATIHINSAITGWKIYTHHKPLNLSSLKIELWENALLVDGHRILPLKYSEEFINDQGFTSADGIKTFVSAQSFTPDLGDLISYSILQTGATGDFLRVSTVGSSTGTVYTLDAGAPQDPRPSSFDWAGYGSFVASSVVPIVALGRAPDVLMVGDSIAMGASGMDLTNDGIPRGKYRAANTAIYYVAAHYGWVYGNLGRFGEITWGLRARFQTDVIDKHPRLVILHSGTNNAIINMPVANTLADYSWILDQCVANNIIPVVSAIFPAENAPAEVRDRRDSLRDSIRMLVARYPTALYIDATSLCYKGFTSDRIHPTAKFNRLWGEFLARELDNNLRRRRAKSLWSCS